MCGRARCTLAPEAVLAAAARAAAGGAAAERQAGGAAEAESLPDCVPWVDRARYAPGFNLAPGAWLPVVRAAGAPAAGGADEPAASAATHPPAPPEPPPVLVHTMRWGLVPSLTRADANQPLDPWRAFNARAETAADKPFFRRLVRGRRCLVLMDGFFE
jgi:putative SOS response-associated peptidase YedK